MSQHPTPKQAVTYIRYQTATHKPIWKVRAMYIASNVVQLALLLIVSWLALVGAYALVIGE